MNTACLLVYPETQQSMQAITRELVRNESVRITTCGMHGIRILAKERQTVLDLFNRYDKEYPEMAMESCMMELPVYWTKEYPSWQNPECPDYPKWLQETQ